MCAVKKRSNPRELGIIKHFIIGTSLFKPKCLALQVECFNPRNIRLEDSFGILNVEPELQIRVLDSSPRFFQLCDMKQISEPVFPLL